MWENFRGTLGLALSDVAEKPCGVEDGACPERRCVRSHLSPYPCSGHQGTAAMSRRGPGRRSGKVLMTGACEHWASCSGGNECPTAEAMKELASQRQSVGRGRRWIRHTATSPGL